MCLPVLRPQARAKVRRKNRPRKSNNFTKRPLEEYPTKWKEMEMNTAKL